MNQEDRDVLLEKVRALKPAIGARAAETEALRRPHDETMRELAEAGVMHMFTPRRWGGSEADIATMLEVVEEISSGCMSTGWIAAFYIGHNLLMAKFPVKAQEEMFQDKGYCLAPAASSPTMSARKVDGGYVISGRAPWGTGVMHADWVMVSGLVEGEGPRCFVLPISDVRVDDVWFYTGMSGTGSNDIVAEEAFVPEYRTLSAQEFRAGATEGSSIHDNPLFSAPFVALAYCEIVGVFSGGLRGMAEAFGQIVDARVRNFTGAVSRDLPQVQIALGEAKLSATIAGELSRVQAERTAGIIGRRDFTLDDRIGLRAHAAFIAQHCRSAANEMIGRAGASNFAVQAPIQRFFRDINMLANHAFWDWDASRELLGRHHLGLPPNNPLV